MYIIRGKLDNGHSVSGSVPGKDAADALANLVKSLPVGRTLSSVSVKSLTDGKVRISKPREKKAKAVARK